MSDRGPFSPLAVGFLAAGVVAVFALSVVLSSQVKEDEGGYRATRSSPSAIGHVGFFTLLGKLDLPVGYSKSAEAKNTADTGLLIVQEPSTVLNTTAASLDLESGPDVLVVLPKYWAERDHSHGGWVRKTGLIDLSAVRRVMRLLDGDATVTRSADPIPPDARRIAAMPTLGKDTQVISGRGLVPIIGTSDRMLLAEVETPTDQHIYVLADPDPLENHGIVDPANARFAAALVRLVWNGHKAIVFDETVHAGYVEKKSPLALLFQFPYSIVLGQSLLAVALLLLATTSRFGGSERPPTPYALGKTRLIDNIAALMDRAGHQGVVLRRYIRLELHDAGRALHAPPGLDDAAMAAWLDRVGGSRRVELKSAEILERSRAAGGTRSQLLARLFRDARDMHRWKRNLLDEPRRG